MIRRSYRRQIPEAQAFFPSHLKRMFKKKQNKRADFLASPSNHALMDEDGWGKFQTKRHPCSGAKMTRHLLGGVCLLFGCFFFLTLRWNDVQVDGQQQQERQTVESSQSGCRRRRGHHLTQSERKRLRNVCESPPCCSVHLQEEKEKTRVNEAIE